MQSRQNFLVSQIRPSLVYCSIALCMNLLDHKLDSPNHSMVQPKQQFHINPPRIFYCIILWMSIWKNRTVPIEALRNISLFHRNEHSFYKYQTLISFSHMKPLFHAKFKFLKAVWKKNWALTNYHYMPILLDPLCFVNRGYIWSSSFREKLKSSRQFGGKI